MPAGERVHDCAVSLRRLKRGESSMAPFLSTYMQSTTRLYDAHTPDPFD